MTKIQITPTKSTLNKTSNPKDLFYALVAFMVHLGMYNHLFNQLTDCDIFTGKCLARVTMYLLASDYPGSLNNEIKWVMS